MAQDSREVRWHHAVAGILAGLATVVLVVFLWFTTRGSPTATTIVRPGDVRRDPDAGPVIGRFSAGITKRLNDTKPSTTPLRAALRLTIRDIEWTEPGGRTFARAASANAELQTDPLTRGDVVLDDAIVADPEIFLRESSPGVWNFAPVFEDLLNAPEATGPKRIIHVNGLRIANGYVDVKRPLDAFSFRSLESDIEALSLSDPRLAEPMMLLSSADAVFERPSSRTRLPMHASNGTLTFPDGTVKFNVASVDIENTRIATVHGTWNPRWEGYAVEAEGDALNMEVADFRSFAPERMPDDGRASFHFKVRPLPGDGTAVALTNLKFDGSGAAASGALAFQFFPARFELGDMDLRVDDLALSLVEKLSGRKLPYAGTVAGTLRGPARDIRLDMIATLTTDKVKTPFETKLTGSIAMLESGLSVRGLTAGLDAVPLSMIAAFLPGIPLTGNVTGTIALSGAPATTPLQLDMRLELGTGLVTVNGMLDMTRAVPRYDLTGRLLGIDLQSVLEPAVPPVTVGARFALAGTGFAPDSIDATLRLDGGFAGWRANPGDTLIASIRIRDGGAEVDTLVASLATANLQASGNWRFVEPLSGAVTYHAAITSLQPFGPYLPVIGDSAAAGAVEATGNVSGSLSKLRVAGRIEADEARSGEWSASSFEATYAIAFGEAVPEIQFEAAGRGISTPTAGTYAIATANMRLTTPSFQLDFKAQRAQSSGAIEVAATGSVPSSGARELFVQRAFFDLQEGRWELGRDVHVAWGGDDGLRVDSLVLRNQATQGEVIVNGRVLPLQRADFSARVAALPVGDIQHLLGRDAIVTGLVWSDIRIQPPGDAPHIDATFRLDNGSIQGIPVARIDGTFNYADRRALARFTAALDTAGSIDVDAAIPVAINLTDSTKYTLLDVGALTGHIVAHSFSLAPVDSFITMVRGVAGQLNGSVTIGGTVADPQLNGDLTLAGGNVVVPQLNQTYRDIQGTLHFGGRTATLQTVSARSDGTLAITGDITFAKIDEPVFDLTARLDDFRPIGVDNQDDAAVDGELFLRGKLDALVLTGGVTLHDGYLLIPQFGADFSTSYGDLTNAAPVLGTDFTPNVTAAWMNNFAVRDMTVNMDGVWVAAQEAKLQLAGTLTVNKSQDNISVIGDLEGSRGTYTLTAGPIARRFDITHALVRFQGGSDMNPAISVDARRTVLDQGKRLSVDVHIGGTVRGPTLSLASADAPNIPESELLSYLLFGRSTIAVGDRPLGRNGLLGETVGTALSGTLEAISAQFEQALVGDFGLPLDVFQINVGLDGRTSFVLGRQIANDLFVSFESGLAAIGSSTGGMNDWALRFEWAFAPQSSLQFGLEPVRPGARIRGLGSLSERDLRRQEFVELRRRWNW
ncbi:MAG: translocation/assembly module TamB domain-containing protein [Longimicrobiales bacterium]